MSLQEVVDLAPSLPRGEQIQLVEELRKDPFEPSDELLKLVPRGSVAAYWHVEGAPESKVALVEMLAQIKAGRQ